MAACEDSGNLAVFCIWWKCQKSGPNLDALALSGLAKGVAGNKCGVPTRSRRGRKSLGIKPTNIQDRIQITDSTMGGTSSTYEVPSRSNMQIYQSQAQPDPEPLTNAAGNYSPIPAVGIYPKQLILYLMGFNRTF